jgi:two-component system, NtrC family, sensor kinase
MKILFSCLLFFIVTLTKVSGQDYLSDSLRSVYENSNEDSVKASALIKLAMHEWTDWNKVDSGFILLNNALAFATQKNLVAQEIDALNDLVTCYNGSTVKYIDQHEAYITNLRAISLARQYHLKGMEAQMLGRLSAWYINSGNNADSARILMNEAMNIAIQNKLIDKEITLLQLQGKALITSKPESAKILYLRALSLARQSHLISLEVDLLSSIATLYSQNLRGDSAIYWELQCLRTATDNHLTRQEIRVLVNMYSIHRGVFLKDSFVTFYNRSLLINRQAHCLVDSLQLMNTFAGSCEFVGNFPVELQTYLIILHGFELRKDSLDIEALLINIGQLYQTVKDYRKSIEYFNQGKTYGFKNYFYYLFAHVYLAESYLRLNRIDSARYFADKSYKIATDFYGKKIYGGVLNTLGGVYLELGEDSLAHNYLHRSYEYFIHDNSDYSNYCESTMGLANYFKKAGATDTSIYYARLTLKTAKDQGFLDYVSQSSDLITAYFQSKHNTDSAYYYQQIGFDAYKSLYNDESSRQFQNLSLAEAQRVQDIAQAKKIADDQYKSNLRLYALLAILLIAFLIGFFIYRSNRLKQKAYDLLKRQKQEIDEQKSKLEESLTELQTTQAQLIQSEKMASLGELTAGIAHEIQNPLNFVNNFSEVNSELIAEMKEEIDKGNLNEVKAIANDISENEQKINHHGKRADAIVKGMLQHSRSSAGQKELTDINALADEYLRLAYHGLRAKDKSFNATLNTDFDQRLDKVSVVSQDIGRVILNLFTNAFYSVTEKKKSGIENYEPTVSVSTKRWGNKVEIRVGDNGFGVPQKVIDKIFQPFFTTKPVGQGTGLGLSLSYDIIKAHGGDLKVETKEGEFAEFLILLPLVKENNLT